MEGLYLYTFVVKPHDPSLNTEFICSKLFEGKCLVVLELQTKTSGKNPHTHWLGYSSLKEEAFNDLREELITKVHYMRKTHPNCRPCRKTKGEATVQGFQYMMKHDTSSVLYSLGLSDGDLLELREQSEIHVKELKHGFDKPMWDSMDIVSRKKPKFKEFLKYCKCKYLRLYKEAGKPLPPSGSFKSRLFTIMMNWSGADKEFLENLSEHY